MRKADSERQMLRDFAEFVEADPVAPSAKKDRAVLHKVFQDLRPSPGKIFTKLTLVEVAAGLVTLTICPQFGLGFGKHVEFLHGLHAATPPAVFYLLCGGLFVALGAALGGLVLTRHEILAGRRFLKPYFAIFSILAYTALVTMGPEVFVAGSLTWILGAMIGNILGFEMAIRLRQAGTVR